MTRGENGCFGLTKGRELAVPGYVVPVVETTGAGDAFLGGLLAGLLALGANPASVGEIGERDLRAVLRLANGVGALTTTGRGAIPSLPTRARRSGVPRRTRRGRGGRARPRRCGNHRWTRMRRDEPDRRNDLTASVSYSSRVSVPPSVGGRAHRPVARELVPRRSVGRDGRRTSRRPRRRYAVDCPTVGEPNPARPYSSMVSRPFSPDRGRTPRGCSRRRARTCRRQRHAVRLGAGDRDLAPHRAARRVEQEHRAAVRLDAPEARLASARRARLGQRADLEAGRRATRRRRGSRPPRPCRADGRRAPGSCARMRPSRGSSW